MKNIPFFRKHVDMDSPALNDFSFAGKFIKIMEIEL